MKIFYRNRLPHIAPPGATFFVTFRLGDSLPQHLVQTMKEELSKTLLKIEKTRPEGWEEQIYQEKQSFFKKYDRELDCKPYGNCYLRQARVAQIVIEQMGRFDNDWYELQAYCVMPNHVHMLIDTSIQLQTESGDSVDYVQLDKIMHRIKGASSRYANIALGRTGKFWQKDSYDHVVRNQKEWEHVLAYIVNNPVKAGLVEDWRDWPFTYLRYD